MSLPGPHAPAEHPSPAVAIERRRPKSLRVLAALFVVTTLFDRFVFGGLPLVRNASSVVGLLLLLNYGAWLATRGRLRISRPMLLFSVFMTFTAVLQLLRLSIFPSEVSPLELPLYFQYVQIFVVYLAVFDIARDLRTFRIAALALVCSVTAMALISLVFGAEVANSGRVGVSNLNLNNQAFLYSQVLVGIFCWVLAHWPKQARQLYGLAAAGTLCLLALVNTASRGGTAALLFGLGVGSIVFFRGQKMPAYLVMLPILCVVLATLLLSSDVLRDRFADVGEGDTGLRAELFEATVDMIEERPWTGWGAAYTDELNRRMGRRDDDTIASHNTYTQVPVTFGAAGLMLWLAAVGSSVRHSWRSREEIGSRVLFVLLITALFSAASMSLGYQKYFWVLFAVAGGTAAAGRVSSRVTVDPQPSSANSAPAEARR